MCHARPHAPFVGAEHEQRAGNVGDVRPAVGHVGVTEHADGLAGEDLGDGPIAELAGEHAGTEVVRGSKLGRADAAVLMSRERVLPHSCADTALGGGCIQRIRFDHRDHGWVRTPYRLLTITSTAPVASRPTGATLPGVASPHPPVVRRTGGVVEHRGVCSGSSQPSGSAASARNRSTGDDQDRRRHG